MDFCSGCNNFYFTTHESEPPSVIKFCKRCGHSISLDKHTIGNSCIFKTDHKPDKSKINLGKNLFNDPTIAFEENMNCPECDNNKIKSYMYDSTNMKYIYICGNCDAKWKIE